MPWKVKPVKNPKVPKRNSVKKKLLISKEGSKERVINVDKIQ
jgi:hypothetical protein